MKNKNHDECIIVRLTKLERAALLLVVEEFLEQPRKTRYSKKFFLEAGPYFRAARYKLEIATKGDV